MSEFTDACQRTSFHVVLYQPEIPQNTGTIGRTCVAVGAKLWLVRPLGFHLDDRHLRRAGLDYWKHLDWEAAESWAELKERLNGRRFWYFTKWARKPVWDADFRLNDVLVFGPETRGLPQSILEEAPERNLWLPMYPEARSLNLANAVAAAVYEALRQVGGLPERET